ncbi:MAG: tetratricopeptide repeat protein [Bacteroidia bacterium]
MPKHYYSFSCIVFACRRMMKSALVLLLLMCVNTFAFSQPTDDNSNTEERLAGQYYQLEQWDLAADMYSRLYSDKPVTFYYNQLLTCYINMKDQKAAEKLINKHVKRNPRQLNFQIDLAYVYSVLDDEKKAQKEYEKVLKELNPQDDRQVTELANAYLLRNKIELAEKTYLQARSKIPRPYNFEMELADIYIRTGETSKMLDEYFRLLNGNGITYIENIQNRLQDIIVNDAGGEKTELLREKLLKEVQRNPENLVFSDLLVWMFIQKKDFGSAITQSKALDKRFNESGSRVLQVARICMDNDAFEEGKNGYEYLMTKGPQSAAYVIAKQELAIAFYDRLLKDSDYTAEQLGELEVMLKEALQKSTDALSSVALVIRLGHLKAFYKDETDAALALLNPYMVSSSGLPDRAQNEVKLEVADIQLLSGDVWEATLSYSQIEKAMKPDTLSQEAKFRNARLAYYKGDFEWAKAQLDVLKAATSKFIANDAMELSLLIGDNLVFDTTGVALSMFARADLWMYQGKINMAVSTLDSLSDEFPESTLADDILYRKAGIAVKQKRYEDAAKLYQQLISVHHEDILADNGLYELAKLLENKLNKKEEAMEYYKALLTEFPGSLYVAEARRRFRALRGDVLQ